MSRELGALVILIGTIIILGVAIHQQLDRIIFLLTTNSEEEDNGNDDREEEN